MPETTSEFEMVGRLPTSAADLVPTDSALQITLERIEGNSSRYVELASSPIRLAVSQQEAGNYADAEAFYGKALVIGERALGFDHPALLPALTGLGAVRMLRGAGTDAEAILARALSISETRLGDDEPEVVILLNDLARLCLKQSIPAFAEPALLRLLAIKRLKGEDRPEVATVLASLAFVHQSLGRHTTAEKLWTRVVEIREQTLAPNHLSVATALEHLADACTARGKISKALELLERAQTIREVTLGKDHSSLRASRERVADLQLQASEDFLAHDEDSADPAPLPTLGRLGSGEAQSASYAPPPRERITTARRIPTFEDSFIPFADERTHTPLLEAAPAIPVAVVTSPSQQPEVAPYSEMILSMQAELEPAEETQGWRARATALLAPVVELLRKRDRSVEIGVAATTLVLIAFAGSKAWGNNGDSGDNPAVASESVPVAAAAFAPAGPRPEVAAIESSLTPPVLKTSSNTAESSERARAADRASQAKPKSGSTAVAAASLPKPVNVNLDSVVGSLNAATPDVGQAILSMPASANSARPSFGSEDVTPARRAKLIGAMPVPRYPIQLSHLGGEVRIRFMVDVLGRPMMATFSVMSSPDARLTAAVKDVVPRMRFEPALTEGPSAKPTSEWVETVFRFER